MTQVTQRVNRHPRLADVALGRMKINERAQRELNHNRVKQMSESFDIDRLQYPTLSERDGYFFIVDGMHRINALKLWIGEGWEEQRVKCEVYSGLSEAEEANLFLQLNEERKAVRAIDKFFAAVTAERPAETEVLQIVAWQGLKVAKTKQPGAITSVSTLIRAYKNSDAPTLGKALRIIRDAYGDPGLEAPVIEGVTKLCQRYNGVLDEGRAIKKLGDAHGGVNGLLAKADVIRRQTGSQRGMCVAAAAVEIINSGKGGKKLPGWW
jgi:hypothetical protein